MCIDGFHLHSVRISWFSDLFRSSILWVVTGSPKCMKPPASGRNVCVTGRSETVIFVRTHARTHAHTYCHTPRDHCANASKLLNVQTKGINHARIGGLSDYRDMH